MTLFHNTFSTPVMIGLVRYKICITNATKFLKMRAIFSMIFAFCALNVWANNESYQNYVSNYQLIAISEMERSGIPASIKLAQGILESNAGQSYLAQTANNHFGIKCGKYWNGPKAYREDDDFNSKGEKIASCFRKYRSAEKSFVAHTNFLTDQAKAYRYGFLFELDKSDYKAWAKGLQSSGYATNPNYAKLLIRIIEDNKLYEYDKMASVTSPDIFAFEADKKFRNGLKIVYAESGDSPLTIALKNGLDYRNLVKYNEKLKDKYQVIEDNTVVYLQAKRSKYRGDEEFHVVQEGETLFDISQLYGVNVNKLRRRNLIPVNNEPFRGERIFLKRKIKYWEQPKYTISLEERKRQIIIKERFYKVKKGDTLYSISKRLRISITDLKILNNLISDNIAIGQKLRV